MRNSKVQFIVHAAMIAAIYVVLTYFISAFNLASGAIQVRISEALTILPYFTPAAIPGLFVGCLLANLLTGAAIYDVRQSGDAARRSRNISAPQAQVFMHARAGGIKYHHHSAGTPLRIWTYHGIWRKRLVDSVLHADRRSGRDHLLLCAWNDSFECTRKSAQCNL